MRSYDSYNDKTKPNYGNPVWINYEGIYERAQGSGSGALAVETRKQSVNLSKYSKFQDNKRYNMHRLNESIVEYQHWLE